MKVNQDKLNPGVPLGNFQLNLEKAKYLVQKLASEYFHDSHAEIGYENGCPSFLQIGSWIPPRDNDPGTFSEKVSLGVPNKEFADKIDLLFKKYTRTTNVN